MELDTELTDGQMADWISESESGDFANHGVDVLITSCAGCHRILEEVEEIA